MAEEYDHALPELRWFMSAERTPRGEIIRISRTLQQRWRTVEEGKAPTHEWRDVPEVKEE